MSQNTTTSPNSNVPGGKKKKEKIPDEQGVCGKKISSGSQEKTSNEQELHNSGRKVSQKEKIPLSRFSSIMKAQVSIKKTHPTRRNFWVVREKVSLKEKFPTSMNFRVKKTQVSPKYKLWELKNQIMCNVKIVCPKE
jgi:hypothetical protein